MKDRFYTKHQVVFLAALLGFSSGVSALPIDTSAILGPPNSIQQEHLLPKDLTPTSPFRLKIEHGYNALKQNDLAAAEQAFTEASDLKPQSAIPYLGLAEVAGRKNQPEKVEHWLEKARTAEPSNPMVLRTLGRYRLVRGDPKSAEKILKKALSLQPNSVMGNMLLGDTYLKGLKQPAKAEIFYKKATHLGAHHMGAYMGLAAALAAQGKVKQALAVYTKASKLAPNNPLPVLTRARLLASQTRFDEAISDLNKAISIDPTYLPAYLDKGDLLLLKNDFGGAASAYKAATKSTKRPAIAYFKLATVQQIQKKWRAAEQSYLNAIKHDPKMFGAYNNLAWMTAARKVRLNDALGWAKKAIALSPKNGPLYDTLGTVYMARSEVNKAISAYSKAVSLSPSRPEFHYRLGLAYIKKGELGKARTALKQSLDIGTKFASMDDARRRLRNIEKHK